MDLPGTVVDLRGTRPIRRRPPLARLAFHLAFVPPVHCRDSQGFPAPLATALRPARLASAPIRELQKSGGDAPQAGRGDYCAREGRSAFPAEGSTPRTYCWSRGALARSVAIPLPKKGLGVSLVAGLSEAQAYRLSHCDRAELKVMEGTEHRAA
jgi:hypothetical protein